MGGSAQVRRRDGCIEWVHWQGDRHTFDADVEAVLSIIVDAPSDPPPPTDPPFTITMLSVWPPAPVGGFRCS